MLVSLIKGCIVRMSAIQESSNSLSVPNTRWNSIIKKKIENMEHTINVYTTPTTVMEITVKINCDPPLSQGNSDMLIRELEIYLKHLEEERQKSKTK